MSTFAAFIDVKKAVRDRDYGRDCGMKVSEEDVEGGEKYV